MPYDDDVAVVITREQVDEFSAVLYDALARAPDNVIRALRVSGRSHRGLPISFDGDLKAFLDHTIGYHNSGKLPRVYVSGPSRVLDYVRHWLNNGGRGLSGGRVFLNSDCALLD